MGVPAKVARWGNSLGIRLPAAFARSIQVAAGDMVDLALESGGIVLRPLNALTVEDLREQWDGRPYQLDASDQEWLDAPARGVETW
jgi:antitoxin MazE